LTRYLISNAEVRVGAQEAGCVMPVPDEMRPVPVSCGGEAEQTGETRPGAWERVERSVRTKRMLEALEKGVKGGV